MTHLLPEFWVIRYSCCCGDGVQVLLETGTLVTFTAAHHSGDVEGIVIDRTLITQLDGTVDRGGYDASHHILTCPLSEKCGIGWSFALLLTASSS